jgi:hypothetical protein
VSPGKKAIATAALIAGLAATGLSPAGVAWAADGSDIQDLRREVSTLRAEVEALQKVIAETTELERQRSANLTRAVRDSATPAEPAPSAGTDATTAPPAPPRPTPPAASADDDQRPSPARHRRHRRSPRSRSKMH